MGSMIVALMALLFAGSGFAQTFPSASNQNFDGAVIGDNTAGAETGIQEFAAVVLIGIGVFVVIALLWAGWNIARRIFRQASRANMLPWLVAGLVGLGTAGGMVTDVEAQLADRTRMNLSNTIGTNSADCSDLGSGALTAGQTTAGCTTLGTDVEASGIYEFQALVLAGIGVFAVIALLWTGWAVGRRIIMGAARSG